MVMTVCSKLGKSEEEVQNWEVHEMVRWMGFFKLESRLEAKAIEEARRKAGMR